MFKAQTDGKAHNGWSSHWELQPSRPAMEAVCSSMKVSAMLLSQYFTLCIGVCCHLGRLSDQTTWCDQRCSWPCHCASLCIVVHIAQMFFSQLLQRSADFSRSLSSHRPPPSTEEGIRGPEDDDRWGGSYQIRIKSLRITSHTVKTLV